MKEFMLKYIPFPVLHWIRTYVDNPLQKNTETQISFIKHFLRTTQNNLNKNRKQILFYPQPPSGSFAIYKILLILGYRITNNPKQQFHLGMKWENTTQSPRDEVLYKLSESHYILNINCTDISKSNVDKIFHSIFGYGVAIDPLLYSGECVVKSELNAQHDGKVVSCPITEVEPGVVYNKIVDNQVENDMVLDVRVPIFKNVIPHVYLRYHPLQKRFGNTNLRVELVPSVEDVFSPKEVSLLIEFCQKLGLDYGELDVLRDKKDGRIYVVDVNNTPYGPPKNMDPNEGLIALKKMAQTFEDVFFKS